MTEYMQKNGLEVRPAPTVIFSKEKGYIDDIFGRTAWYSPEEKTITLITEGRHPKDILRSFAHEMVHHSQNLRGEMKKENISALNDPKYAQNDKHLRKMEEEAYLKGNLMLRDWEDHIKNK